MIDGVTIAAIVVGALAFLVITALLVVFLCRRRRRQPKKTSPAEVISPYTFRLSPGTHRSNASLHPSVRPSQSRNPSRTHLNPSTASSSSRPSAPSSSSVPPLPSVSSAARLPALAPAHAAPSNNSAARLNPIETNAYVPVPDPDRKRRRNSLFSRVSVLSRYRIRDYKPEPEPQTLSPTGIRQEIRELREQIKELKQNAQHPPDYPGTSTSSGPHPPRDLKDSHQRD